MGGGWGEDGGGGGRGGKASTEYCLKGLFSHMFTCLGARPSSCLESQQTPNKVTTALRSVRGGQQKARAEVPPPSWRSLPPTQPRWEGNANAPDTPLLPVLPLPPGTERKQETGSPNSELLRLNALVCLPSRKSLLFTFLFIFLGHQTDCQFHKQKLVVHYKRTLKIISQGSFHKAVTDFDFLLVIESFPKLAFFQSHSFSTKNN